MTRWPRMLTFGIAVLGALGVLSVAATPDHELHYDAQPPQRMCGAGHCYGLYRLEIGNTGSESQAEVRVRLDAAVLDTAVLTPTAAAFGVRRLPLAVHDGDDGMRTLVFGPLAPRDRVDVRFTLPVDDVPPAWDALRLAVEPTQGGAHRGSPAALTFGRFLVGLAHAVVAFLP